TWRAHIEDFGIFVYLVKMDIDDCRGATLLWEGQPPTIVINDNEFNYEARTFSLLHEYGHILLRQPGISDERRQNRIEWFCNRFAAAVLMPRSLVRRLFQIEEAGPREWSEAKIALVAKQMKVSRWSLAIRLETLGFAPENYSDAYASEHSE